MLSVLGFNDSAEASHAIRATFTNFRSFLWPRLKTLRYSNHSAFPPLATLPYSNEIPQGYFTPG
jgi:hypothetical protein